MLARSIAMVLVLVVVRFTIVTRGRRTKPLDRPKLGCLSTRANRGGQPRHLGRHTKEMSTTMVTIVVVIVVVVMVIVVVVVVVWR